MTAVVEQVPPAATAGTGPVPLREVADRLAEQVGPAVLVGDSSVALDAVAFDHRRIAPPGPGRSGGTLFCCLPGAHHDGHEFAAAALEAGAVAFLCEHPLGEALGSVPSVRVAPGLARAAMAHAACCVEGDPARRVTTVGVTGTNGKTTTTHLLAAVLRRAGFETGVIGTLSGARTTPEAPDLQAGFASVARAAAATGRQGAVALEVTSHALVQHRVDGYRHDVAVFTNLSQDHLDFHHTMEEYFRAKASLFTPDKARLGVVNADDGYGRRLLAEGEIELVPFSRAEAGQVRLEPDHSTFLLYGRHVVRLGLPGAVNVDNALAAAAAARCLGIGEEVVAEGLSAAPPVPGRFEPVPNALGLDVLVDFAHTPAGLTQALATLAGVRRPAGRLLLVVGAGGDRDREKRPLMGAAASRGAEIVVLTSDNPRHEDPAEIVAEIRAGCDGPAEIVVEVDRRRAIALALERARPGDLVLVAGKGHETTQQVGDELLAFDDRLVVADEARRIGGER